jgi:hypothetical protein
MISGNTTAVKLHLTFGKNSEYAAKKHLTLTLPQYMLTPFNDEKQDK